MKNSKDTGLYLAISFLIIGLIAIFFPFNLLNGISLGRFTLKIDEYDKLGAFIAGLTAPFLSISAFILLYLTYKSQKEELADSKIILKSQSETLEKQQFETTFFNLLNLHHSIVNSTDVKVPVSGLQSVVARNKGQSVSPDVRNGRDCFTYFYERFANYYHAEKNSRDTSTIGSELSIIQESYDKFYSQFQFDLGHYFRNLYHVVKFVNRSSISNKQEYISLIRAQLSSHEILVLFYNGLSYNGTKFKPLIEKYHLLKNMPKGDLLLQNHLNEYDASAY
ncbi:putative phage abortive infection protein [Chitinophaga sp. 30R24]|uniref:putative phage abortive infection protein n=1 Tax=Chitinophaga sp. 30R24 TaxID=3248838 RepID=UPI003B917718